MVTKGFEVFNQFHAETLWDKGGTGEAPLPWNPVLLAELPPPQQKRGDQLVIPALQVKTLQSPHLRSRESSACRTGQLGMIISRSASTKYHEPGGFKTNTYCLTVLETGHLRWRC